MTAETPQNIAQTVAKILEKQPDVVILPAEETYRNLANPLLASVPAGRQIMDLTNQLRTAQGFVKPLQRKGRAIRQGVPSGRFAVPDCIVDRATPRRYLAPDMGGI